MFHSFFSQCQGSWDASKRWRSWRSPQDRAVSFPVKAPWVTPLPHCLATVQWNNTFCLVMVLTGWSTGRKECFSSCPSDNAWLKERKFCNISGPFEVCFWIYFTNFLDRVWQLPVVNSCWCLTPRMSSSGPSGCRPAVLCGERTPTVTHLVDYERFCGSAAIDKVRGYWKEGTVGKALILHIHC